MNKKSDSESAAAQALASARKSLGLLPTDTDGPAICYVLHGTLASVRASLFAPPLSVGELQRAGGSSELANLVEPAITFRTSNDGVHWERPNALPPTLRVNVVHAEASGPAVELLYVLDIVA